MCSYNFKPTFFVFLTIFAFQFAVRSNSMHVFECQFIDGWTYGGPVVHNTKKSPKRNAKKKCSCVVLISVCCDFLPLCCATFVVLQLFAIVLCSFRCVVVCFSCVVLISLCCGLFSLCWNSLSGCCDFLPLCCSHLVVLWLLQLCC